MVDVAWIPPLLTSLKTAADLTKTIVNLRDAAALQSKVIELQLAILSAQNSALAAQNEQSLLLERIRTLEQDVADMKAWEAEQEKYELSEVYPGAFAYVLKEQAQAAEPSHWLCTTCYQERKKGVMNFQERAGRDKVFQCGRRKNKIVVGWDTHVGRRTG